MPGHDSPRSEGNDPVTIYALLLRPDANRVYAAAAPALVAEELRLVAVDAGLGAVTPAIEPIGGVPYLVFDAPDLDDAARTRLSDLSGTHALFRRDGELLAPVEVQPTVEFDDSLITIPRYRGKTNEQFTHLLVNVARAVSTSAGERATRGDRIALLDPLAGRGTTMHRAMTAGYDTAGIEADRTAVDQHIQFLKTFLRDQRVKHRTRDEHHRKGELAGLRRTIVSVRDGVTVDIACGDTAQVAAAFGAKHFDLLVTDLPYGIQHKASDGPAALRDLLDRSLDSWRLALRFGAGAAIATNTRAMDLDDLAALLGEHRFEVVDTDGFLHDVDRTIRRGVVVARAV